MASLPVAAYRLSFWTQWYTKLFRGGSGVRVRQPSSIGRRRSVQEAVAGNDVEGVERGVDRGHTKQYFELEVFIVRVEAARLQGPGDQFRVGDELACGFRGGCI